MSLLHLQGRVAGAVGLDTGQGELQTYVSMWQLQPFLDDGMVQELVRLSASD